jgi:hypothetical protein
VLVKNDRRFDRRFSQPPELVSGAIADGTGGPGAALGEDSSSRVMGTGDGLRELLGEGEGRGCDWPRVDLACSLLSRVFLKSPEKLAGKVPFRALCWGPRGVCVVVAAADSVRRCASHCFCRYRRHYASRVRVWPCRVLPRPPWPAHRRPFIPVIELEERADDVVQPDFDPALPSRV